MYKYENYKCLRSIETYVQPSREPELYLVIKCPLSFLFLVGNLDY